MFLKEGMNDFVAKPIEMRTMLTKLRNWLPKHKIRKAHSGNNPQEVEAAALPSVLIEGLDTATALKFLRTEKLFWAVLKDYYLAIPRKAKLIKELETKEEWKAYTVEVHALKSASKQVGAMELSEKALILEKAGNEQNGKLIHECTDELISLYTSYIDILKPYFAEENKETDARKKITADELKVYFEQIREAMDDLEIGTVLEIFKSMAKYSYEEMEERLFEQLGEAVAQYDVDKVEEIIEEWEDCYRKEE